MRYEIIFNRMKEHKIIVVLLYLLQQRTTKYREESRGEKIKNKGRIINF